MADTKNQTGAPKMNSATEKEKNPTPQIQDPALAKAIAEIRKSDDLADAAQDSFYEQEAIRYLLDTKNKSIFSLLPKNRQDIFVNDVVAILKKYKKDASQIQVLCSIALEKARLDIGKYGVMRELVNDMLDIRKNSVNLRRHGMNPQNLGEIKKITNYFTHLSREDESERKDFATWLAQNPDIAVQIRTTWKEPSNSVRYFLEARGDSQNVIAYIDSITAKTETRRYAVSDIGNFLPSSVANPWKKIDSNGKGSTAAELAALAKKPDSYSNCMKDPAFLTDFLLSWNPKNPMYDQLKKTDSATFAFFEKLCEDAKKTLFISSSMLEDKGKSGELREQLKKRIESKLQETWDREKARQINRAYATKMQEIFAKAMKLSRSATFKVADEDVQKINAELAIVNEKYKAEEEWINKRLNNEEAKGTREQFFNIRSTEAIIKRALLVKEVSGRNLLQRWSGGNIETELKALETAFTKTIMEGRATIVAFSSDKQHFSITLDDMRKQMKAAINQGDCSFTGNSLAFANYIAALYDGTGGNISVKKLREELGDEVYTTFIRNRSEKGQDNSVALQNLKKLSPKAYDNYIAVLIDGKNEYDQIQKARNTFKETKESLMKFAKNPEAAYEMAMELDKILKSNKSFIGMQLEIKAVVKKHAAHQEDVSDDKIGAILGLKIPPEGTNTVQALDKQLAIYTGKDWKDIASFQKAFNALNARAKEFAQKKGGSPEALRLVKEQESVIQKMADRKVLATADVKLLESYQKILKAYGIQDETVMDSPLSETLKHSRKTESIVLQAQDKPNLKKAEEYIKKGDVASALKVGDVSKEDANCHIQAKASVRAYRDEFANKFGTNNEEKLIEKVKKEVRKWRDVDTLISEVKGSYYYSSVRYEYSSEGQFSSETFRTKRESSSEEAEKNASSIAPVRTAEVQNITRSFVGLSQESRMRIPVWEYPIGESVEYKNGWSIKNKGADGIELESGTTKVSFDAKEEIAGMQLFHLLEWANLLCLMPHIKDMIGQSHLSGINFNSSVDMKNNTSGKRESKKFDRNWLALNEGEQRRILAMIGDFFLGDDEKNSGGGFQAEEFARVDGTRRGWVAKEFNAKVLSIAGKDMLSVIRAKGYLNLDNQIKDIDQFKSAWKTRMQGFDRKISQTA